MGSSDLVVVSNRGPLSFQLDEAGQPVSSGPAGGLAGALAPMLKSSGATWVAAAMTDADRKASAEGLMTGDGYDMAIVEPEAAVYRMAYDIVSNATLWFLHHHLFDLSHRPRIDVRWMEAWEAYRSFNQAIASTVGDSARDGAVVLVQDYHLSLVPGMLARARPDLRVVHFSHTPFADPGVLRVLPEHACRELLAGMSAARACGFHTSRWEAAFRAGCADVGLPPPRTFVAPLGPEPEHLLERAGSPECTAALGRVHELARGRRMILRVDRVEPSKNFLRGFVAFEDLLRRYPRWRGEVVFVALAYPSRQSLAEYVAYGTEVELAANRINETWADADWTPVVLDIADDPDRSFAALTCYDVLFVNPVRDGLNLVAKEGPIVNRNDGVVALSREAGAYEELSDHVIGLNPFDVAGTSDALDRALAMPEAERKRASARLRRVVAARTARDWLTDQLLAAGD